MTAGYNYQVIARMQYCTAPNGQQTSILGISSGNNNSTLQSICTVVYSTVRKKEGPVLSSHIMNPPSLPLNNGRSTAQKIKTVPK
jgi:hypothetical protein